MNVWFTSDTHYGHSKIIDYCGRPFNDVQHMREGLILAWNKKVHPRDLVYVVGDFALYLRKREVEDVLRELHGDKVLVKGNHDHRDTYRAKGWQDVTDWTHVRLPVIGKQALVIHDPHGLHRLPFMPIQTVIVHGHTHGGKGNEDHRGGQPEDHRTYIDVGVDCFTSYAPISLAEVTDLVIQKERVHAK